MSSSALTSLIAFVVGILIVLLAAIGLEIRRRRGTIRIYQRPRLYNIFRSRRSRFSKQRKIEKGLIVSLITGFVAGLIAYFIYRDINLSAITAIITIFLFLIPFLSYMNREGIKKMTKSLLRKMAKGQEDLSFEPPEEEPERECPRNVKGKKVGIIKTIWISLLVILFFYFFFKLGKFIFTANWTFSPGEMLKGIYIGFGIIGAFGFILFLILFIRFLGRHDIFFTIVNESTAKLILKFEGFHKIKISFSGHDIDKETWDIRTYREDEEGEFENHEPKFFWLKKIFSLGGLRWLGIPFMHSIHKYEMYWLSFRQKEENGRLVQEAVPHGGILDYISLKDEIYFAVIENAETKDGIQVDMYFQLTLRVINPRKALFEVENWIEACLNLFRPVLRNFIATKTLEQLIGMKEDGTEAERNRKRTSEAKEMIDQAEIDKHILARYGIQMIEHGFGIASINPKSDEYSQALTKKWLAEREADRLEEVYGKIAQFGDTGKLIRTLEALERVGAQPSKTIIFPLGSAQDIIKGWIGREREEEK